MVAQQGETVQRIDADVHDISTFVFLFRALLSLLCIGTLMKTFSLTAFGYAGTYKAQRANCSSTTPA